TRHRRAARPRTPPSGSPRWSRARPASDQPASPAHRVPEPDPGLEPDSRVAPRVAMRHDLKTQVRGAHVRIQRRVERPRFAVLPVVVLVEHRGVLPFLITDENLKSNLSGSRITCTPTRARVG